MWDTAVSIVVSAISWSLDLLWLRTSVSQDLLALLRRPTDYLRSPDLQSQGRFRANRGSDGFRWVETYAEEWPCSERNA